MLRVTIIYIFRLLCVHLLFSELQTRVEDIMPLDILAYISLQVSVLLH